MDNKEYYDEISKRYRENTLRKARRLKYSIRILTLVILGVLLHQYVLCLVYLLGVCLIGIKGRKNEN